MQTFGPAKFRREQFEKILDSDIIRFIVQLKQDATCCYPQRRGGTCPRQGGCTTRGISDRAVSIPRLSFFTFSKPELTENRRDNV